MITKKKTTSKAVKTKKKLVKKITPKAVAIKRKSISGIDYFEKYNLVPANAKIILEKYKNKEQTYPNCEKLKNELNKIGWTIDYELDAFPYNLRKIKVAKSNTKKIATKKKLTAKKTKSVKPSINKISNEKAIRKFAYFCANFDRNFVVDCFGSDNNGKHLLSKWNTIIENKNNNSLESVLKFYYQLDSENEQKLSNYILKKYTGVGMINKSKKKTTVKRKLSTSKPQKLKKQLEVLYSKIKTVKKSINNIRLSK